MKNLVLFLCLLSVGTAIDPPAGTVLLGSFRGRGFQVYRCNGGENGGNNYTLEYAIAELFTSLERESSAIGKHYFLPFADAGGGRPTWALFDARGNTSSTVTGKVMQSVARAGTIPDLLLQATSHNGVDGLADVTFIMREESLGGNPGEEFCCRKRGEVLKVPYEAWYRFYAMDWKSMAGEIALMTIKASDGVVPLFRYFGEGEQIYTFNGSAWVQKNVSASLFSLPRVAINGRHFYLESPDNLGGQPSWETFNPKSFVTGKVLEKIEVGGDNIPWLLLAATSHGKGNISTEPLSLSISHVIRAYTTGGVSPSSSVGARIGDIYASPYTAVYWFYSSQSI